MWKIGNCKEQCVKPFLNYLQFLIDRLYPVFHAVHLGDRRGCILLRFFHLPDLCRDLVAFGLKCLTVLNECSPLLVECNDLIHMIDFMFRHDPLFNKAGVFADKF